MQKFVLLNLEGPMMSFGGSSFDAFPDASPLPTKSMLAGLIGNALGFKRCDGDKLNALQSAMALHVAILARGKTGFDFQTTDITKPHMLGPMWTRKGVTTARDGGADALQRQVRHTPFLSDAHVMVFATMDASCGFTPEQIMEALNEPVRPLYLGRAAYMTTAPIGHSIIEAEDFAEALAISGLQPAEVWEPIEPETETIGIVDIAGLKDFRVNWHVGTETYWRTA